MAHPYESNKTLHTDRLGKMLNGMARESGPKAMHSDQMGAAKGVKSGMAMHGAKAKFARGGRTKAKTNININVMPAAPDAGAAIPPVMPPGVGALPPPMPKPPMGPPPGIGGPPGMPPGMPPGAPMMPHKLGGRAFKKGGSVKAEGMKNGTKVQHAGQNDKKDINRPPVITRKAGGRAFSENVPMKAIKNKDGGNGGKGRMAKAKLYGGK